MRDAAGRAVSDTLGFVLVFGIIVSTVAVVYVGGFDALTGARDAQRFANTERAFDAIDANVEDLLVRGAPSRTTEIVLSDGTLTFGEPVSFNVTNGGATYYSTTVTPIVYRADDGDQLVYANGALFRQYGDRAVMFDEPRISDGDRLFVPYVVTRAASDSVATSGTRRLLVRTVVRDQEVRKLEGGALELVVTSPRAGAWQTYLEDELDASCSRPGGDTVRCPLSATDVYVQAVVVDVAFT
ncbi:MAG: hypothetical protein ABEJ88_02225 [Halobacterium sp.]